MKYILNHKLDKSYYLCSQYEDIIACLSGYTRDTNKATHLSLKLARHASLRRKKEGLRFKVRIINENTLTSKV